MSRNETNEMPHNGKKEMQRNEDGDNDKKLKIAKITPMKKMKQKGKP